MERLVVPVSDVNTTLCWKQRRKLLELTVEVNATKLIFLTRIWWPYKFMLPPYWLYILIFDVTLQNNIIQCLRLLKYGISYLRYFKTLTTTMKNSAWLNYVDNNWTGNVTSCNLKRSSSQSIEIQCSLTLCISVFSCLTKALNIALGIYQRFSNRPFYAHCTNQARDDLNTTHNWLNIRITH